MTRVSVFLPDVTIKRLKELASEKDLPVAELIRRFIDAQLNAEG